MKIAMYVNDKGGLKTYSKFLVDAMKKNKIDAEITNNFKEKAPIYHIQFESSLFHPFGLGLVPSLILLNIKRKKIILTMHTVLSKKDIYARNSFVKTIKKIILPIGNKLICMNCDKIIVHRNLLKNVLVKEYNINPKKIEVIAHGAY